MFKSVQAKSLKFNIHIFFLLILLFYIRYIIVYIQSNFVILNATDQDKLQDIRRLRIIQQNMVIANFKGPRKKNFIITVNHNIKEEICWYFISGACYSRPAVYICITAVFVIFMFCCIKDKLLITNKRLGLSNHFDISSVFEILAFKIPKFHCIKLYKFKSFYLEAVGKMQRKSHTIWILINSIHTYLPFTVFILMFIFLAKF
jgi:hypothetical protein